NIRRRPPLSRLALTVAGLSAVLPAGGGSGGARGILGGGSATGGGISSDGRAGVGTSGAGDGFGAGSGLLSPFDCCAALSDAAGANSPDCRDAGGASSGFSDAPGSVGAGAGA